VNRIRGRGKESLLALLFLFPSIVLFGVFVFYPLVRTFWLGFFTTDFFGGNRQWIGWQQYRDVITSSSFRQSLWHTVQFTLLTVPAGLALGLALAVAAHKRLRGIGIYRTVFSSTVATSVAVASLIWLVLLNPSIGILVKLLPFEALRSPGLLGRTSTAMVAVSVTTVWQNLGFIFILMTAGLQSIPEELYESARIDGLSGWKQFTGITVPMLSPTLLFGTVVLTITAFQSFGQIDLLTSGGPQDSTNVLIYSIYRNAFGTSVNQGVAAATSIFLFLIVVVLSILQFKAVDRRVHYR
jgi:ABC-type sugar transport system permease subunit